VDKGWTLAQLAGKRPTQIDYQRVIKLDGAERRHGTQKAGCICFIREKNVEGRSDPSPVRLGPRPAFASADPFD